MGIKQIIYILISKCKSVGKYQNDNMCILKVLFVTILQLNYYWTITSMIKLFNYVLCCVSHNTIIN